jgi:DNA replicative helicase MCM subunit Mcm2 (Cdc46/Mcm family)
MLREYWVRMGEAGVTGLPRKLDTLERIALARAKLKLKDVAGEEEATETMQYYNVILEHYQQTVTISKRPSDTAYLEVVEVVKEQNGYPISYAEAAAKACNRNEQVRHYLGDNNKKLDLEGNWS